MNLKLLLICLLGSAMAAAQPRPCAGRIETHALTSNYIDARTVQVWLPADFKQSKKYDVLYMHDGQMLFDSSTTWNRQEWQVDETLNRLRRERKIRPTIVVAIPNNGSKRHAEFFPQKAFEMLPPMLRDSLYTLERSPRQPMFVSEVMSDSYLKFLVYELKPLIDKTYPTRRSRKHTFVAGSSMGGLISLYAMCEYPKVFGGVACLSTHWTGVFQAADNPIPATFVRYLEEKLPLRGKHKFYFDHGTATIDAWYADSQQQVDALLKRKGIKPKHFRTYVFEGEPHNEQAWAKRLYIPFTFLLGKP